ncbi:acyltransferase [Blastococcus sp. TF02A-30]|uniref:acyltransferase family protein n=1 Tax=Blastococcus sp. TF02A-30 TaxID=2250580 RepID=UPI0011BFB2EB|nr:acyltransferase [Blastococcus sp. TF02A-30]
MTAQQPVALSRLPRRIPEIRPLTGLRIVAALLVVVFHIRGNLRAAFPDVAEAFWPILDSGLLGVDLFFALSGFVLTINYVDAAGVRLARSRTARFLWARIARIWPAYAVTLLIAGIWHAGLPVVGWEDPVPPEDLSAMSFLRQFFLVVLWDEPGYDRLTWNGPAWSVSAEALAYLAFPVLALLLFRLDRAVRARTLIWLGLAVLVPLMILGSISLYGPYLWLIRLAGGFVAGSLAALVVRKVWAHIDEHPHRSWPTVLTWVSVVGVVGTLYLTYGIDRPAARILAVLFFPLLLIGLSLSRSGLSRLLATEPFVFGGRISYSVYLTHMVLVIEPFWALQTRWPGSLPDDSLVARSYFIAVPVLACLTGWLLWRFVEEPAQRKMRTMVVDVPAEDAERAPELPTLQPAGDTVVGGRVDPQAVAAADGGVGLDRAPAAR